MDKMWASPSYNSEVRTGNPSCRNGHSEEECQSRTDLYEIVPDGKQFAIAFRGEVMVYGLNADDLAKAQGVLAILNSVIEDVEEAGCETGHIH